MWKPFRSKTKKVEVKATTMLDEDGFPFVSHRTTAGQLVNNATAMTLSTVYDCIRIISEDLAKLPMPVLQNINGLREPRPEHTLHNVLNWQPNPEMSAMSFRNTIIGHAVGWGNGYAEKVRDANGDIIELWIIPPDRIKPMRDKNGTLYYEFREDDGTITNVRSEKIFHVPGFGYDGVQGYNVVQIARESIGLAKAAEMFGSKFFGNGAKASLALTFENTLTENAYNNLKRSMEKQIGGDNQHRILLVEEGGKVETMSLSQKDSQYLETREFSLEEICRWFRVNPHKVADLRRATFSNIEHQNIDHVNDTLMPWFIRVEQAVHNQLFTIADQQAGYYVKHNANALLRGDSESRSKFYKNAINDGWATRNEVRAWEDMNPLDGLDEPLVPLNMRGINEPIDTGNNEAFVEDVAARITAAEERGLSARVDKANDDRDRFNEWVNGFYEKHEQYIIKSLAPLNIDSRTAADRMVVEGILNIAMSDDPAAHIKTWNRKQEITDIINEALLCTHK